MLQGQEVRQLEEDITSLRADCDLMSSKVTHLTQGKGQNTGPIHRLLRLCEIVPQTLDFIEIPNPQQ